MILVLGVSGDVPLDPILPLVGADIEFVARTRHGMPGSVSKALARAYDSLFNTTPPEAVADAIADDILAREQRKPVVYFVPSAATLGDATVYQLVKRARAAGVAVTVTPGGFGVTAVAPEIQIIDALTLAVTELGAPFDAGLTVLDASRPALVTNWRGRRIIEPATLRLQRAYQLERLPTPNTWGELLIEEVSPVERSRSLSALEQIVAALRAPGGCPWDQEQTPQSLAPQLVEEAHELVEAVQHETAAAQAGEMGDVLVNLLLMAQIAREAGEFTFEEVIEAAAAKMVRRHPHVFGDVEVASVDEVLANWQRIKAEERSGGAVSG